MHDFYFKIHNKQTRSWPGRSESEPFQRICECLIIGDTFSNDQSEVQKVSTLLKDNWGIQMNG